MKNINKSLLQATFYIICFKNSVEVIHEDASIRWNKVCTNVSSRHFKDQKKKKKKKFMTVFMFACICV